jgi:7-cyano-7-deazaguanine synthase
MNIGLLLSGGMDSICVAYWKRPDVAFTINYGQLSAEGEIQAASAICQSLNIKHEILTADCRSFGSGYLAGKPPDALAPVIEWWPFRNQLLLTLAGMRGIGLGIHTLLFGLVKTDSAHADGREEFFKKLDEVFSYQEGQIRISVPAINLTTPDLVRASGIPLSLLAWSHSCHVADLACGNCRGCFKNNAVMKELGYGMDQSWQSDS